MYKAFISYRKKSSVNADCILQCIVDESEYCADDIFLDRRSIGPEFFDDKIKKSIELSNCVVVLVTKDCFKAKDNNEEDWFLEEVRTALTLGKTIIPVLFDNIGSLSNNASIKRELDNNFSSDEVEILLKSQCVPYSTDFPEASIIKLVNFIREANKPKQVVDKVVAFFKGCSLIIAALIIFFVLFFGLGFLWGYFTSSTDVDKVLTDNTIIDGSILHFEYGGWEAIYNLDDDSISIDVTEYNQKPKEGNVDVILSSFTFTGAKFLLEKNLNYLKYVKFFKGGPKQSKIAFFCASAAVCVGSFCGFSQGCNFGRVKRQEEIALSLYPKLQQRSSWAPLVKDNIFLKHRYNRLQMINDPNCIVIGKPKDSTCVAFNAGLRDAKVLLKYNDWEISRNTYKDLEDEIITYKDQEKISVFLDMEDLSISEFNLPKGVVGIGFEPGDGNQGRLEIAKDKFREWQLQH